jgi:hypothetical protein
MKKGEVNEEIKNKEGGRERKGMESEEGKEKKKKKKVKKRKKKRKN